MRLYQLAEEQATYGERAGWWMVVSDNEEDELAGPFETREQAEQWMRDHEAA